MKDYIFTEQWREIVFEDENIADRERDTLLISSFGRIKSFKGKRKGETVNEGRLLKGSKINGYATISLKTKNGNRRSKYIHKLVAQTFMGNDRKEEQIHIIHIDYDKTNNKVSNLKWATRQEALTHQHKNPLIKRKIYKLTEGRVKIIKKKLLDPKRKTRIKMIAKQFGVSEMQLYRIKSGENWGHVKVD